MTSLIDKGYLKSLEKFGQKIDLYLEQNPNKNEVQEASKGQ